MIYDEAIKRLEEILKQLESEEALSISEFKTKAKEAKELIAFCQKELQGIESDLKTITE